jgi:uncharacterized membrane protein YeiH
LCLLIRVRFESCPLGSTCLRDLSPFFYAAPPLCSGVQKSAALGVSKERGSAPIPAVLRTDIYAVDALVGVTVVVIGFMFGLPSVSVAIIGGVLCSVIRMLAIQRHWKLPTARHS